MKSRIELLNEFELAPESSLFAQDTVAAIMDCSIATVERDRWLGTGIPFIKVGRMVRYKKSDVKNWIQARTLFHSTTQVGLSGSK